MLDRHRPVARRPALLAFAAGAAAGALIVGFCRGRHIGSCRGRHIGSRRGLGRLGRGRVAGLAGAGFLLNRAGFHRSGFLGGLVGTAGTRFGHGDSVDDRPGAVRFALIPSSVTISLPSMVTSPAPMVSTTSPACAAAATAAATAEKSGT